MATNRRRVEIETTETQVIKKRKTVKNGVVQEHQQPKIEAVIGLGDVVEVVNEVGLVQLPWWPSDMIDERMSWSMVWLPNWDAEFVGRAYHLLYGDVAWDDDIWGLKSIHQIPTESNL